MCAVNNVTIFSTHSLIKMQISITKATKTHVKGILYGLPFSRAPRRIYCTISEVTAAAEEEDITVNHQGPAAPASWLRRPWEMCENQIRG